MRAFRLADVTLLPEEGYNIDPCDLRRRRIFLYNNRELLKDVQKTDDGWPFPLGRVMDEALDIAVEFTYCVSERRDEPFVNLAAPPLGGTTLPPEARRPTNVTTRRSRGKRDDGDEDASPRAGLLPPEPGSPNPAESGARRKRQRLRQAGGYDHLDEVRGQMEHHMKRRALLCDVLISIKRAR